MPGSFGENDMRRLSVRLEPAGWTLQVVADAPLLQGLAQAGVTLPTSCRNGTCRTCMCRLIGGKIRYDIEWPGLSAEEKQEGYILPCVAYPESDVVIETMAARKLQQ
jgi:ferredoxin